MTDISGITLNGTDYGISGGGGTTEVFIAEYNSTTNAQIETAINAGQAVYVHYNASGTHYYEPLIRRSSATEHRFGGVYSAGSVYYRVIACVNGTWSTASNNIGTYSKPSGGIPSSDLESAVQTSLGLADTAVQPTQEVTVSTAGAVTQALDAGKIYHFTGALTSLTITLNATTGLAQYHFDFLSGSTAPTLTMPGTVTMPDSFAVEASKRYEVDVLNNYGAVISWATS